MSGLTSEAPFRTGEPFSGPDLAGELTRLHAAGAAYLGGLSTADFHRPQGPHWSPAGHVRHLTKSILPVTLALRLPRLVLQLAFGRPRRASRDFAAIRDRYQAVLAQGGQAGIFAPRPRTTTAEPEVWRTRIMARWEAASDALVGAVARWDEAELDACRLPHPLLGRLTVRELLEFTLYHTAHHLRRIRERAEASRE